MTTMFALGKQRTMRLCAWLAATAVALGSASAQRPAARILTPISSAETTVMSKTARPYAQSRFDTGRLASSTPITGITLVFGRTEAQETALKTLIAEQQNPASPQYHKWLTPEQFGARFGLADSDLQQVEQWVEQQGFTIDAVGRAKNWIRFSGTAGQVEQAFQTEMHNYKVDGVDHVSPATAPSLPTALAGVVEAVHNLTGLKPRATLIKPRKDYTFEGSNSTYYVLFAPGDIKIAYDIKSLISAGNDGTGQTIAVMGQSAISTTDITNFQTAAGLTTKAPNVILVPGTGSSATVSGDEGESDLDLEWSGAIAPGATIYFVYTGNSSSNNGVFDSIAYAVDNSIGNIISVSYGACELELDGYSQDSVYEQAESQGQSIIASSGDDGSTGCFGESNLTTAQQQSLAVNYPSSSPYVTGLGGTEITQANDAVGTYWSTAPSNGITLTSALSYIPEVAWNDDTVSGAYSASSGGGLSATGGGVSTLYTSQPSWQTSYFTATGETNPNSSARLVPDVSLYSSPNYPGYLYCTSDTSDWSSGQTGSCVNDNFYDASGYFTVAGGTSFAAPIFAGMTAILNQAKGYTTGQGLLNPELYTLAANSTTYASAFHDVTSGNNYCTAGTTYGYCSSSGATEGYAATTGYDLVTGLGSVDLANLVTAWPESTSTLIGTTTTVSAANTAPAVNVADNITITVASTTGSTVPTGSVSVSINGGTATTYQLSSNGTYVLSETFTTAGTYTIAANYLGDTTHSTSSGAVTVTVGGTSSGTGSFTLTATNPTISQGSSGTSTVTVTPAGGYTGTVNFSVTTSSSSLADYGCYSISNATVSSTSAVSTALTIYTSSSSCSTASSRRVAVHRFSGPMRKAANDNAPANPRRGSLPYGLAALAGVVLLGLRKRARWIATLGCLMLLAGIGLTIGCGGGSSSSSTSNDVPKGTYTMTVTGSDTTTSSITATTNLTLTVD